MKVKDCKFPLGILIGGGVGGLISYSYLNALFEHIDECAAPSLHYLMFLGVIIGLVSSLIYYSYYSTTFFPDLLKGLNLSKYKPPLIEIVLLTIYLSVFWGSCVFSDALVPSWIFLALNFTIWIIAVANLFS